MLTCDACFNTLEGYCAVLLQWRWFCTTQSLFPNWSGWSAWVSLDTSDSRMMTGGTTACHHVHHQSEGMYSNIYRVSEKSPYTSPNYLCYNTCIVLCIQCICAAWWLAQRLVHRHIICIIFLGIYSVNYHIINRLMLFQDTLKQRWTLQYWLGILPLLCIAAICCSCL
jgi:hypothetical protein